MSSRSLGTQDVTFPPMPQATIINDSQISFPPNPHVAPDPETALQEITTNELRVGVGKRILFAIVERGEQLPRWFSGKESACQAGNAGSIPGGGNGNPPQYSCQENPMDKGAWWATIHGVTKSWT